MGTPQHPARELLRMRQRSRPMIAYDVKDGLEATDKGFNEVLHIAIKINT
jgi:hypothetical protein